MGVKEAGVTPSLIGEGWTTNIQCMAPSEYPVKFCVSTSNSTRLVYRPAIVSRSLFVG